MSKSPSPPEGQAEQNEPVSLEDAAREVAEDFDPVELQYLSVNIRHARGALPKELRQKAIYALIGLKYIIEHLPHRVIS